MIIVLRTVDLLERPDPHPYQRGRFLVYSRILRHSVWAVWK